jgi:hypothetical protein
MSHWVRLWEGMPNDPKWRVVKARAMKRMKRVSPSVPSVSIGEIVSVFIHMLLSADKDGNLAGWCDEDIAAGLEYKPELVMLIREAMQDKVLDGMRLKAWEKRQPRHDDYSTKRVQAFRKRKRYETLGETPESDSESDSESLRAPRDKNFFNDQGKGRANGNGADEMNEQELKRHIAGHKVYVKQDTPAGEAWARWTRKNLAKSQVWDAKGGWWFPSEYPPQPPSVS